MSFKENLRKKIEIDDLAARVVGSIAPSDSVRKVDKPSMRRLLEMAGYTLRRERDLELYVENSHESKGPILVLDNDLTIYDTTVEDVVLRKSPYIKEMVSIRNIIKILNDKDVVVSRRQESVKRVQQVCIDQLDLSHSPADIDDIKFDGMASLESRYADGVVEVLTMFGELLGYQAPPKPFEVRHHKVIGASAPGVSGAIRFGPAVVYSLAHNDIKLIDRRLDSLNKEDIESFHRLVAGEEKPSAEGATVFDFLKQAVLSRPSSSKDTK